MTKIYACAACQGEATLRCSQCRQAWYCSKMCQKKDWKQHHQRICRTYKELATIISQCNVNLAHQEYQKAQDAMIREQDASVNAVEITEQEIVEDISTVSQRADEPTALVRIPVPPVPVSSDEPARTGTLSRPFSPMSNETGLTTKCSYTIQNLPNLNCYQMILSHSSFSSTNTNLFLKVMHESDPYSRVAIYSKGSNTCDVLLCCIRFPGRIVHNNDQCPTRIDWNDITTTDQYTATIRLSYQPNSQPMHFTSKKSTPLLSLDDANSLKCRFCHNPLITKSTTINSVGRLPSDRWDDMQDYLQCGDESVVDFGAVASSCAQTGRLLQDETSFVLSRNEACCVVYGMVAYGQEESTPTRDASTHATQTTNDNTQQLDHSWMNTMDPNALIRGSRPWRTAVGGAPLACSLCSCILGTCSAEQPDTFRFWKHRLETTSGSSISEFVSHEMIRYAEQKAIFNFRVVQQDCSSSSRSLLLRLLNWDTMGTDSNNTGEEEVDGCCSLEWRRMVQIVYEETVSSTSSSATETFDKNDPMWMWTQDWCCPPIDTSKDQKDDDTEALFSVSIVNLFIDKEEWHKLRSDLHAGSRFYTDAIRQATIMVKTGKPARSTTGISALIL
jgi:hypothetical protein